MQSKVNKFITLSFKDRSDNKLYEIKPVIETISIFNEKKIFQKQNSTNESLEIYYSSMNNSSTEPYPKLETDCELYFLVRYKNSAMKGTINLIDAINNISESIAIKSNFASFQYNFSDMNENETILIRSLSGKEIHSQVLNVQTDKGNKIVNFSFDFTSYPFGVYTAGLKDRPLSQIKFVNDRSGTLKENYALLRVQYDDDKLKYGTPLNLYFFIN